jgi:hypothetical protein
MSDIHEGFRTRLSHAFAQMGLKIEEALERARSQGTLQTGTNIPRLARFMVAAFEGAFMMGKLHRDAEVVRDVIDELKAHVMQYRVA